MTNKLHQSLSAVMDAADDDLELSRLLGAMQASSEQQKELSETWRRYHLTQGILRGDLRHLQYPKAAHYDLSARVMQQLALEGHDAVASSHPQSSPHSVSTERGHWFRGAALAASVAFLVITGIQLINLPQKASSPTVELAQPSTYDHPRYANFDHLLPSLQLVANQPLRLDHQAHYTPPQRFQLVYSHEQAHQAVQWMRLEPIAEHSTGGQLSSPPYFFSARPTLVPTP